MASKKKSAAGWLLPAFALLVTMVAAMPSAHSQQAPATAQAGEAKLDEIVVTAEKRASTVQETPISMTAVSGDQLQAQGVGDVRGVIAEVPGISMRYAGPGQTELEMRGLASSGGASPTVGFYLDETPLTSSANSQNGKVVIDPSLFDLNRVEILRGPQGTLYGSGSMGGTVKLVTNAPRTEQMEGNFDATVSDTQHGGANPSVNAMLNLPLSDKTLALRLVATEKWTSGWVDRDVVPNFPTPVNPCGTWGSVGCQRGNVLASPVSQVIKGVNWENLIGGRASLLFKPSDNLSVNAMVMTQSIRMGGYGDYDQSTGTGYEAHYQPFNLQEPFADSINIGSLTVDYNLGFADLTSATAYWKRTVKQTMDNAEALESFFANFYGAPQFSPVTYTEEDDSRQLSQELRLTSSGDGPFKWVGGVFFSKFESIYDVTNELPAFAYLSMGGAAANPAGVIYDAYNPFHVTQYALFSEGNYEFAPGWKLTAGIRFYHFKTHVNEWQNGIGSASGNTTPTIATYDTAASGVNPKLDLSYTPTRDLTVYAAASRGFRPGGVNLPIPTNIGCNITTETYSPDSVWSYEVGEKAKLLDHRLSINADVFYITWSDVQQQINQGCGYPLTTNAGKARSYGTEIEVNARVSNSLTLALSGTYTNAELQQVNSALQIADPVLTPGSRLLDIPKFTQSASITYVTPLTGEFDFTARLANSLVGPVRDISYTYIDLPSHDIWNARIGAVGSKWAGYFFVDNIANTKAAMGTNTTAFSWLVPSLVRVATNQPRTIGVNLNYRF